MQHQQHHGGPQKTYQTSVQGGNIASQPQQHQAVGVGGNTGAPSSLLGQPNYNSNLPDKLLSDQLQEQIQKLIKNNKKHFNKD